MTGLNRDGATWRSGTDADVAWIREVTPIGLAITSAIPPIFDAYATVALPHAGDEEGRRHDRAVIELLSRRSPDQRWWLGYLDTGVADIVFPYAPRVTLYANWSYVLVQAGPEQAASWRSTNLPYPWESRLPDLMFPEDRSWLLSTLWDDDWTCLGGPATLIDGFCNHPDLRPRARQVNLGEDATPPGRQAR